MKTLTLKEWKKDISDNKGKILLSILFLIIAYLLTVLSGNYVDQTKAVSVPDLILDHIPVINLSPIFLYGIWIVIIVFLLYPILYKPKKIYYAVGMLSLFLCIRAGFLVLTHLKAPVGAISIPATGILAFLSYSNDLFFSGHTGLPFLGFLIFDNKKIKYFMLFSSIILAITSLLMHVHYSIDIASAYFITYGIYKIGNKIFLDWKI
ncbi:MAG: phosphatase PAP2-related protein [Candidatus Pacearchaeota archaeon]|jgi:hypothetical protein